MPLLHLRFPVVHPISNNSPYTFLSRVSSVLEHRDCQSKAKEFSCHGFAMKRISPRVCFSRVSPAGALQISVADVETSSFCSSTDGIDSFSKQASSEEAQEHGNKGKVPWNKGRKHSAETRLRIKQKTIEALRDPKIREKLSANPRPHSDVSKARIQSSLRRVWAKRLKWNQSREKLHHSWLESIANYAKSGADGEKKLDWDSYDKIKEKIAAQLLRRAAEKEKAKEMSRRRRERAAHERAEKTARIAQRRKDREELEKRKRAQKRKAWRESKKDEEKVAGINGLKLKQMLTKIRRKKIINGQVTIQGGTLISHIADGDKLDIELVKRERMRKQVSLADQIQAARNRRADSSTGTEIPPAKEKSQMEQMLLPSK